MDDEPSVWSSSSSALRLDEDATALGGETSKRSLEYGGVLVAGEALRRSVVSAGNRRRFAGGGLGDARRVLIRPDVASRARRLERLTVRSG